MQLAHVDVGIPKEILLDAGLTEKTAAVKMRRLFVIDLFKNRQISGGKGAELLGIGKYDFIRILAEENVNFFEYSAMELEEEFKAVDQWENYKVYKLKKHVAKKIMDCLAKLGDPLNDVAEMIEQIQDIDERKRFRRGIADIMARIYTNLEMPITMSYPELDIDRKDEHHEHR